jgi:hypothetical protein
VHLKGYSAAWAMPIVLIDMQATAALWRPNWSFDRKCIRFVGLDAVGRVPNVRSTTKISLA